MVVAFPANVFTLAGAVWFSLFQGKPVPLYLFCEFCRAPTRAVLLPIVFKARASGYHLFYFRNPYVTSLTAQTCSWRFKTAKRALQ